MRILITAGPTREPIDPVRFLSNRSSGKMGYSLAVAAVAAGHDVVLISGPTALSCPQGVEFVAIETAEELYQAVKQRISTVQLAIFSAAVADYRPAVVAEQKIKKTVGKMTLELERTPDVLGAIRSGGFDGILVGFAAETTGLLAHAREKLMRKGCDLIVANDVSRKDIGFDSDHNAVTLLFADGRTQEWDRLTKRELAEKLIGECVNLVK